PALAHERRCYTLISCHVPRDLRYPIRRIVSGSELRDTLMKVAPVPEIPIDENHYACASKDHIRTSGEIRRSKAVPQADRRERLAQHDFAACVHFLARSASRSRGALRCWLKGEVARQRRQHRTQKNDRQPSDST